MPVDIWSSGICLLELMNGKPPNNDSSIKAMFLVGIGEAPVPTQPGKWSFECKQFIDGMLTIEQTHRPTAVKLLEFPFLAKAAPIKTMTTMLQQIFLSKSLSNQGFGLGGGGLM